jgi:ABC-type lipoprotein export system ATPase subunit
MSVLVRARGLKKSFGATSILKGVDVDIRSGEFVCVWGPSGAGKSTLLHVLGLMTPPDAGSLSLFDRDVVGLTPGEAATMRNRKIGFLFQAHHLLPDFSILENVMIPLLLRGDARASAASTAKPLLERLGLGHRLTHRPSEASGGELQRTALARALITGPSLVLADEPTGNLDRDNGEKVERLLEEEVRARGASLVLVTHNEALARRADRRLILMDGQLSSQEGVLS